MFFLAVAIVLPMDAAFMPVFSIAGASPSLAGVLAAFVSLNASRRAAWWGCFVIGLLIDFSSPHYIAGSILFLPGPNTLGFALGSAAVTVVRALLLRRVWCGYLFGASAACGLMARFHFRVAPCRNWASEWVGVCRARRWGCPWVGL